MRNSEKDSVEHDKLADALSFFAKLILIWLSWKIFIYIIGEEKDPIDQRFFPELSIYWESLNDWLRVLILEVSNFILQIAGHKTHLEWNYVLRIDGYGGIALGNYCLGFQLMYYFTMLVLVTGFSLGKAVFGIVSGIAIIQILNVVRITGLVWIDAFMHQLMFISHDYIFNIVVLGILLLFYWKLVNRKD